MSEVSSLRRARPVRSVPATLEREQKVFERAVEVIGNRQEAMRWLGTPVRALAYATPISLVHSRTGCEAVLEALGRLEYGVM